MIINFPNPELNSINKMLKKAYLYTVAHNASSVESSGRIVTHRVIAYAISYKLFLVLYFLHKLYCLKLIADNFRQIGYSYGGVYYFLNGISLVALNGCLSNPWIRICRLNIILVLLPNPKED
ncbi:unnamed protein product [Rhizophagus irregularis]|nr:unnamed protein product [Rhizophagus irregularis]